MDNNIIDTDMDELYLFSDKILEMAAADRKDSRAPRIIIKVGSDIVSPGSAAQRNPREHYAIPAIANHVAYLHKKGVEIILVTSGAVATGKKNVELKEAPHLSGTPTDEERKIVLKQAYAAIGQTKMMQAYEQAFAVHDLYVGQLLVTKTTFENESQRINTSDTIETLLHNNIIPIINENDTVATEEIKFGDNDPLSAQIAKEYKGDMVIKLTSSEGVINRSCEQVTQAGRTYEPGSVIELVDDLEALRNAEVITCQTSVNGRGMSPVLDTAQLLMANNIPYIVIDGRKQQCIKEFFEHNLKGTVFVPENHILQRLLA